MNSIPRWVSGLVSSLCLAVNWSKAAQACDPLSARFAGSAGALEGMAPPCTQPCAVPDDSLA
jgi:hypothetical protein